jgi:hypothetical protein
MLKLERNVEEEEKKKAEKLRAANNAVCASRGFGADRQMDEYRNHLQAS